MNKLLTHIQRLFWFFTALFVLAFGGSPSVAFATDPAVSGQWQLGPLFPYYPIHLQVLPTGKVMMWPGNGSISGDDPRLFDPATNDVTDLSNPGYNVFCSAHTFLPDGRLMVIGGHVSLSVGLPDATIYDYRTDSWSLQPPMNLGRWYPSSLLLPNGDLLALAGTVDVNSGSDPLPQVFEAATNTWRDLSSAQLSLPIYPKIFLAPNGKVFNAGPTVTTRYLDTSGTGAWSVVAERTFDNLRDYGAAVTYAPGKIMALGGFGESPGTLPTATTEVIDLNAATPQWTATQPMNFARRHPNVIVLPDGKILATGGTRGQGFDNKLQSEASLAAESWDPATGQWTVLDSASIRRTYHSSAFLLPDGRIFTAGGDDILQTEFYSPPYLFQGPRPLISSTPSSVIKGETFFVGTPDAASIDSVTWTRLPSVTHSTNFDQGFIQSTNIVQADGGINIVAPNTMVIPSGYYMLFLMRGGVPSVANIVRLDSGVVPPTQDNPLPVLTSISPTSETEANPGFKLTLNGSNFSTKSIVQWNGANRPTFFVSDTKLTANIPTADLKAGTAQVTVFNPAPGGGTSAAQTFTIDALPFGEAQNLTQLGKIIARVTQPIGGGSKNPEVIRDGIKPPAGSDQSASLQYDTWDGKNTFPEDWIGYQYTSAQTFGKMVFQEGKHFFDGGWFTNLTVQVLQNGTWIEVSGLTITPVYPKVNNGVNFETYEMKFTPITGNAIRLFGIPGGSSAFISVAELEVYTPGTTPPPPPPEAPVLTSIAPNSKTAGDPTFTLTVLGSHFLLNSTVQWNGADRTTTFVSTSQLTATIPATDIAAAGTAEVVVYNPESSTPASAAQPFTINVAPPPGQSQNLTALGTIIARVTAPTGGGSKNLETIRDGVKPDIGNATSALQYDTYDGNNTSVNDWIGYQYSTVQTFDKMVFQEGRNFSNGGFFTSFTVQVLQNGTWNNVSNLVVTPTYPTTNNGLSFETYTLQFTQVSGSAIRIFGDPGGSADFISVGELEVYGPSAAQDNPAPVVSAISPSSKTAGDPGFTLTVNGSNFVANSTVQWNGANRATTLVNATQLTATIPASDVAAAGTAQVTVVSPAPGGGISAAQSFTINAASAQSQNLTALGTIIARVTAPTGGGSKNIEIIRDGVKPAVGNTTSALQYDTYDGNNTFANDWIGYQYSATQTFDKMVFQEGKPFSNGGWFTSLTVQVLQNGTWNNVSNLVVTPTYPNANNGISFETYTLQFTAISGSAIRIFGDPGGSADFISVGELEVYGQTPASP